MDFDHESDSTDDIYEVERIIDAKRKDGKVLFKVRWEGYGSEEDSWEPSDNLLTCQELVDRFWLERKEGYKKRGRKPKRLKEMAGEDSDTDDGNRKDQNSNNESEMSSLPEKRKRGRPPKHRLLVKDIEGMAEKKSSNGNRSTSPELSEGNSTKKKRGRPPKEAVEYFSSSLAPSDLLLLDLDEIAPRGMTRQASKELALVSLRKKQGHDHRVDSSSENRSASVKASSDTKQNNSVEFGPIDCEASAVCSEQDSFEVIEISSQGTDDDEQEYSSQDSKPALMKEFIVISSQSESEEEAEKLPLKSSLNSADKTKLKKKNEKLQSVTQDAEKNRVGKAENSLVKKKGVTKFTKSASVENQAKVINCCAKVDNFPPIEFSLESRASPNEMEPPLLSRKNQEGCETETSKVFGEPEQQTDENSNQVKSLLSRADLSTKLSVSKMQMLRKTMKIKNKPAGGLESDHKSDTNEKNADLSNITDDLAPTKNSSSKLSSMSVTEINVSEASAKRRENNEMEISAWTSVLEDTSQLHNQVAPTMKRLAHEKKNKGKAKRTEGRPKSLRDNLKKRLSIDKTAATQQNISNTEYPLGKINEGQGKMDKQNNTSRTADLLPMQNRSNSAPLMDGDLIGAIIQESGKDTDSKGKSAATAPVTKNSEKDASSAKRHNKAQDETGNFRPWDSGMEDISDGEDDLSDFEFDLDDYSPHSFFNEAEESTKNDRASSPSVEPLNLSWAALRQAIQEGDVMLVRRALAVPGFNPDDVAIDTASGMTLLMWAATSGQDEIVRLLLRRGAGVNTVQKRTAMTALLHAAEQGFPETVQILLEAGAHINWQQTAGETALMKACKKGHEEVVEVLLKHGVDTKAQSNYDQTAIQTALRNQHFEIQSLLQEHEKSLENTLQVALGKCLGTAGTLHLPLVMPYRCIAPGEKESVNFTLKYNSSKGPQGTKVVLFCVKAVFNGDEVCLSFCGDNGVRSVLLNASIQYPLVQGNRSVYLLNLDTESSSNELTVETHPVKSRLVVCAANVSPAADI